MLLSAFSNAINQSRLRVLRAREELLVKIVADASKQLAGLTKTGDDYKKLLRDLVLQVRGFSLAHIAQSLTLTRLAQGLLKLQEEKVSLRCREADKSLVDAVIPDAVAQYKAKTGNNATITVESNWLPPAYSSANQVDYWCVSPQHTALLFRLDALPPHSPQLWWRGSVGTRGPHRVLEHAGPAVAVGLRAAPARDPQDALRQVRHP